MRNEIDNPNYNDTNCGLGVAGYMTPDEKEIERLNKHIESLTAERDALKKRVEELEAKLQEAMLKFDEALSLAKDQVRQLQSARVLAEMVSQCFDADEKTTLHQDTVAMLRNKARAFLKMLEGK